MSGGMGYYDGDLYDENGNDLVAQQAAQQQKGNPLRDHLKKVEDQNTALQQQVAKLVAQQRQTQIADELQAKGYSRAHAALYAGEPEKLDEWLTNVGPLLAKDQTVATGTGQAGQQGQVPASTVPADGQAALQQMQQAGQNAAGPQGSEAEQIAQMRQAQTPEALMQYLQGQGNPYHFNG
jgi:hypothetical protein